MIYNEELNLHYEKAFEKYTSGVHYETLKEAKEEYFVLSGKVYEEDADYELRMKAFNDWYLFQFISKRGTRTAMIDYLMNSLVADEVSKALMNVNYSLFEYSKETFSKKHVLTDILHNKTVALAPNHPAPGLLRKEIFVGRVIHFKGENYLVSGMCTIPQEVRSILKKQSKPIRKMKDPREEAKFLMQLMYLKTKSMRYNHLGAQKIFKTELVDQ